MVLGLFFGWLFKELRKVPTEKPKLYMPEIWWSLAILAWITAGTIFWSYNTGIALAQLKSLTLGITLIVILPLIITNEKEIHIAWVTWIIVGVVAATMSLFSSPGMQSQDIENVADILVAAKNWTATTLSISLFLALSYTYKTPHKLVKVFSILVIFLILYVILFLGSRGTMAGIGVGLSLFFLATTIKDFGKVPAIKSAFRLFILMLLVAIPISLLFFIDVTQLSWIMGYYLNPNALQTSSSGRSDFFWPMAWEMIQKEGHLIRGMGPGAYIELATQYSDMTPNEVQRWGNFLHPHSFYLDMLMHYGVIGVLLFIGFAVSNCVFLWKGFLHAKDRLTGRIMLGMFCNIIAFYIHGIFDFSLCYITTFWLFVGLLIPMINTYARANSKQYST